MSQTHTKKSHKKMSRRCSFEKCNKLAKDFIDGNPLCRIHSPMRKGWEDERKRQMLWEKKK